MGGNCNDAMSQFGLLGSPHSPNEITSGREEEKSTVSFVRHDSKHLGDTPNQLLRDRERATNVLFR